MRSARIRFYALEEEIKQCFLEIEKTRPLKYILHEHYPTPELTTYNSIADIPDLGISQSGNSTGTMYFIFDQSKQMHIEKLHAVSIRHLHPRYLMADDFDGIIFYKTGMYKERYLVWNNISTYKEPTEVAVSLFKEISKRIRKISTKPRSDCYLSHGAEKLYREANGNIRLVNRWTQSEEYDIRLDGIKPAEMEIKRFRFLATKEEMVRCFFEVELERPLNYVDMHNFKLPAIQLYQSLRDIPDLGVIKRTDDWKRYAISDRCTDIIAYSYLRDPINSTVEWGDGNFNGLCIDLGGLYKDEYMSWNKIETVSVPDESELALYNKITQKLKRISFKITCKGIDCYVSEGTKEMYLQSDRKLKLVPLDWYNSEEWILNRFVDQYLENQKESD